jgi:hypothetical protein
MDLPGRTMLEINRELKFIGVEYRPSLSQGRAFLFTCINNTDGRIVFYHNATIRSLCSSIVCRRESREYVTTGIGSSRRLDEERGKQVVSCVIDELNGDVS